MIAKKKVPVPRPGAQAKIDLKVVEGMASVGATTVEIAAFLGISEAVIRKRCDDLLAKARSSVKMRLRQAQVKGALDGNPTLLIWLGKQMLGQQDKLEHQINVGDVKSRLVAQNRALQQMLPPDLVGPVLDALAEVWR